MGSSTRRLSEVARHLVYPDGIVETNWPRIQQRLTEMAVEYDGWQQGAGQIILGLDGSGRYTATVGGVTMSLPRQVGKTFTVGSLLVAMCIEFPGLRVVWTSHHLRTTTNTFRSMQGMVRRKRVAGKLAHNGIRTANGEQEIRFGNGSIIMFGARERGFGVGIDAIDVLVCDEAQRLSSRALADMVPTTNQARHPHGALVFFIGTPPRPTDEGDEFATRRAKALAGEMPNGVYVELSADPDGDLDDPEQWAKANASYPDRTPHESMLRLRENLTNDDDWRREALGVWDERRVSADVVPVRLWTALSSAGPEDGTPPSALAVDMSHNRVLVIAACWRDEDESHVELVAVDHVADPFAALDWLVDKAGRKIPVVLDAYSPAAALLPELKAKKVKTVVVSAGADMARACGGFYDDVTGARLTHAGQEQLNQAVAGATKRKIGDAGGWGWDRRDATQNIAPLVAVTLARYGAAVSKRRKSTDSTKTKRIVVMS